MGIVAIILGIFGIIFGWFPIIQYVAFALSILGIILSAIGLKKSDTTGKGKRSAIAGLVLCVTATVLSGIGVFVCTVAAAGTVAKTPGTLQDLQNAAGTLKDTVDVLENARETLDSLKN
jgi:hypothetical protein